MVRPALLGLAAVALLGVTCSRPPPADVILITVDTWRADRLPLYGGVTLAPGWLDAFAADAVVFDHAVAPAPWTWPTLASVAAGVLPSSHGVVQQDHVLCSDATTLAEVLRREGWATIFAGTNPFIQPSSGLEQGFGTFEGYDDQPASVLIDTAEQALPAADTPVFLWLHLIEPHCPYDPDPHYVRALRPAPSTPPPPAFAATVARTDRCHLVPHQTPSSAPPSTAREDYLAAYDAELLETDAALRMIEHRLRGRGRWDDAWVVLAGDHGEEFGERGRIGHGPSVHAEAVRVPFLIRPPKGLRSARRGVRVQTPVSLIDIPGTVARALKVKSAPAWSARDLLADVVVPAPVRSETDQGTVARLTVGEGHALLEGDGGPRLFREDDTVQRKPLGDPGLASRLAAIPDAPRVCTPATRTLPPDQRETLRALGYVGD